MCSHLYITVLFCHDRMKSKSQRGYSRYLVDFLIEYYSKARRLLYSRCELHCSLQTF
nr:MAG TPA: hypothetical protein [Caudovirales sp. ctIiT24]